MDFCLINHIETKTFSLSIHLKHLLYARCLHVKEKKLYFVNSNRY